MKFLPYGAAVATLITQCWFTRATPLLSLTSSNIVEQAKENANMPSASTDGSSVVYAGTPYFSVPKSKLKNDDVLIPCSECMKLVDRYIEECTLYEAAMRPLISIREYCEKAASSDPSFTERDFEYCLNLGEKLASRTGTNFAAMHTDNHVMGSCAAFQHMCRKHGGPPQCYSGFCDSMASCTGKRNCYKNNLIQYLISDCPYAILETSKTQIMQPEVCSDRGVCRLGSVKTNNGYCECDEEFRGLACDQYSIPIVN